MGGRLLMSNPFIPFRRRRLAAFIFAGAAITVAACSNPPVSLSPMFSEQPQATGNLKIGTGTLPNWIWLPVDYPKEDSENNIVTGITDDQQIVGAYYTGSTYTHNPVSFTAKAATPGPGQSPYIDFATLPPPSGTQWVFMTDRVAFAQVGYAGGCTKASGTGVCGVTHLSDSHGCGPAACWTVLANSRTGECNEHEIAWDQPLPNQCGKDITGSGSLVRAANRL